MRSMRQEICSHECSIRVTSDSYLIRMGNPSSYDFLHGSLSTGNKLLHIPIICLFVTLTNDRNGRSRQNSKPSCQPKKGRRRTYASKLIGRTTYLPGSIFAFEFFRIRPDQTWKRSIF
uniref:Uncharacterized protein n=1 Tax=Opuntia streptacantha TaxID=393608 RepID=A0A7C9ARX3_OPUST